MTSKYELRREVLDLIEDHVQWGRINREALTEDFLKFLERKIAELPHDLPPNA